MIQKSSEKSSEFFHCHLCDYKSLRKSQFERHLATLKHQNRENDTKMIQKVPKKFQEETVIKNEKSKKKVQQDINKEFLCDCGKTYVHKQNLYRHQKVCKTFILNSKAKNDILLKQIVEENSEIKNMLFKQFETMQEQQKQYECENKKLQTQLAELKPKIENNTINNSYEFDIIIERNNFLTAGTHSINIIAKTYNFSQNEILEHKIVKEISIEDSYPEETANYYIDITANINQSLTLQNNSIIYNGKKINKSRNNKYNILYNLPTGSQTINIGNINALDPTQNKLGEFTSTLTIVANSNGTTNAYVNISGTNVIANVDEDPLKAQKVYWGKNIPGISSNDADILTNILEPTDIRELLKNEINAIEDLYSVSIIREWEFNILPVNASINNIPNAFDAYAEIKNRIYPNIFLDGEHIILKTAYPYYYTIQDVDGDIKNIIEETPIYARITHSETAPTI